jgi:hypothetical protein
MYGLTRLIYIRGRWHNVACDPLERWSSAFWAYAQHCI